MMKILRKINWKIFGALLVVAGLAWFGFYTATGEESVSAAQDDDVASVFMGDLAVRSTASGQITAVQSANLSVNSPGQVAALFVNVGDSVEAGAPLLQLKTDDLQIQLERAEQNVALQENNLAALLDGSRPEDIAAAAAAVANAQANLDTLLSGPTAFDIAEAEANLRADQADIASATASYNSTLNSVSDVAIAQAQINVTNAQQAYDHAVEVNEDNPNSNTHEAMIDAEKNLAIAQQELAELLDGPAQGSVTNAAGSISIASANLNGTEAEYDALIAGASAEAVANAEASLAQAEANLAQLLEPATAEDIANAEEKLHQAELAYLDAKEALANATLTAPFAGTVTAVNTAIGEYASGNVVEIISQDFQGHTGGR
jgi:multidrug efflux pump subunit AcrA (membrane-fusion protein)